MTKTGIKHIDELGKASRIIRELGYEPDESMCDDRPDIVLPSKTDRKIGIEVVAYSTHRYEESEDVLYKIFNEYIEERLDKRSAKRYEIGVMFSDLQVPVGINYKKVKKAKGFQVKAFSGKKKTVKIRVDIIEKLKLL